VKDAVKGKIMKITGKYFSAILVLVAAVIIVAGCGDEKLLAERAWKILLEKTDGNPSYADLITVTDHYGNRPQGIEKEANALLLKKLRAGKELPFINELRAIIKLSPSSSEL
jgi:hypothetical protein